MTSLFTSGSRDQVGNYRPISVLPIVAKVFEKEVHKQLYKYLTDNNLLHPSQQGFRRKRSTQTALIKVVDNWLTNINKGQVTAVVFLDLAKAFDTVKHNIQVRKLETLGVTGSDMDWFSSYLDNRQQQVFYNGVLSLTEHVLSGVPQGSCLGPLLFLVYINDLPCCISHSTVNMFADDTALYYSSNNADEILRRLNDDPENISKWIKLNGLALNPKKCEFMVVGSLQRLRHFMLASTLMINGIPIKRVEAFKYLGIPALVCGKLNWSTLQQRRNYDKAILMYKCLNNQLEGLDTNYIYNTRKYITTIPDKRIILSCLSHELNI